MTNKILIPIGLVITGIYLMKKNNNTNSVNPSSDIFAGVNYSSIDKQAAGIIKDKFYKKIGHIWEKQKNDFPFTVVEDMFYSVLYNESRQQILNGTPNNLISGDKGFSVGFFQVSHYAISDVNKYLGTNYTKENCINDEWSNITIGMNYLELCFKSAIKQNSVNPYKLAFKMYNGGTDETDNSVNKMADDYSTRAFKVLAYLQKG